MTWTSGFLAAVAQKSEDEDIGVYSSGAVDSDATIYIGSLPADISGVGIRGYNLHDVTSALISDVIQPVQFYLRGTLAFVNDTADKLFDVFDGLQRATFGAVFCPLVALRSDVPLGVDQNGRELRSVNYDFWANRPNSNRPD